MELAVGGLKFACRVFSADWTPRGTMPNSKGATLLKDLPEEIIDKILHQVATLWW